MTDEIPLHEFLGLEYVGGNDGSGVGEVRMPVRSNALGMNGNLHGGAIATLIDLTCALAAVRSTTFDPTVESLVTADLHVRYVGRPRTDHVVARAEVVRSGSQLIVVDCRVTDEEGHVVASADFAMMKVPLRRPLTEVVE